MKNLLIVALMACLPALTLADELGTPVDTAKFMEGKRGTYEILLAGGEKPHEEDKGGEVKMHKAGEEEFTLPFCQPEGCDPGWIYFPHATTKVYQNGAVATIVVTDGNQTRKYTWEDRRGEVSFKNHQYQLISEKIITLEHVIRKTN